MDQGFVRLSLGVLFMTCAKRKQDLEREKRGEDNLMTLAIKKLLCHKLSGIGPLGIMSSPCELF